MLILKPAMILSKKFSSILIYVTFISCILTSNLIFSQNNYQLAWSKSNASNIQHYTHTRISSQINSQNEIVTAATLIDGDNIDMLVTKYSNSGEIVWKKIIDINNNSKDYFRGLLIDKNDNITIIGESIWGKDPNDIYKLTVLRLNTNGDKIFETNYNTDSTKTYTPSGKALDSDGNIYITGHTDYNNNNWTDTPTTIINFFVIKFNNKGEFVWKDINQTLDSYGSTLKIINDKIKVIGKISNYNDSKLFFRNYSLNGNLISNKEITIETLPNTILIDNEGNSYLNKKLIGVTKYDKNEKKQWEFTVPSNLPNTVYTIGLRNIISDKFGNIYLTGSHHGEHYNDQSKYTNGDLYAAKISSKGKLIYQYIYNNKGENTFETGRTLFLGKNNHLFIGGQSQDELGGNYNFLAIVLNGFGKPIHISNEKTNSESVISSITADEDLNFFITGFSNNGVLTQKHMFSGKLLQGFNVFPNPFKDEIMFSLKDISLNTKVSLYDITGKQIFTQFFENTKNLLISTQGLKNGVYIYKIKNKSILKSGKIVKTGN